MRTVRRKWSDRKSRTKPPALDQLGGFNRGGRRRRAVGSFEHSRRQSSEAEAVSSRMAGAPAQEKIDKPTGTFLRPRSDIAPLELLA